MSQTVLLVDDSKTARMMAKHWISAQFPDTTVIEADSGEDAIAQFDALPAQFTGLIDYNMPGLRGIELAEKMLVRFPESRILLCTANIQDAVRSKAEALGIEFVAKPLTPPKIKTILSAAGSRQP